MPRKPAAGKSLPAQRLGNGYDCDVNVFVIGDLVIDHTVFVKSASQGHLEPVTGENAFQVQRRLDTAGGAATAARTISVFSEGTTYLWGILGTSRWGTFRSILENSQALDGAMRSIELRGTQDETDAPMSTVSRLVLVQHTASAQERYERKARFVDSGKVHVPLSKLNDVLYHLQRVHQKSPLDAIVLDDLNAGALTAELVAAIAEFGQTQSVPLVARIRRSAQKYTKVRLAAIVSSLAEWVHLVGSDEEVEYWKQNITKSSVADDFARRSLLAFPYADYHITLVGDDWIDSIITIEPSTRSPHSYRVASRAGVHHQEKGKSHQVGTSDVFTGVIALELSAGARNGASLGMAVGRAIHVISEYQRSGWHRVPQVAQSRSEPRANVVAERAYGTRYLPPGESIDLAQAKTRVPGILSITPEMTEALDRLAREIDSGWDEAQSMILVASGGSGKTGIADELINIARRQDHNALWFHELNVQWNWSTPEDMIAAVRGESSDPAKKWFVAVDEVLKLRGATTIATKGVILLNLAKDAGVRFLFIDADFSKARLDGLQSQFGRRCSLHVLPSAWNRANDIPYVMAHCLRRGFAEHPPKVSIETAALVAVIEWMLDGRRNFGELDKLCKQLAKAREEDDSLAVKWSQLPATVRGESAHPKWASTTYRVTYD